VRFHANQGGTIDSLSYYRGTADAADTDARTLHLWSASGALLGTASVTSTPGQTGWQTAVFAAPIAISAGIDYVASYGTTQNYAFSSGFFATDWFGEDGVLAATGGANGVFSNGATGGFPTQNYNNANYWVDAHFEPALPPAAAALNIAEAFSPIFDL
jgi:Domain of unknown function (DUF4082)